MGEFYLGLTQWCIAGGIKADLFEMLDTCWNIRKGSKLRLDVSSSNYPAYHVHPNTTECWAETTKRTVAHQSIYCGGECDSRITVPVISLESKE